MWSQRACIQVGHDLYVHAVSLFFRVQYIQDLGGKENNLTVWKLKKPFSLKYFLLKYFPNRKNIK